MPLLTPTLFHHSVTDIDLDVLESRGIKLLLVDIDNTILPRDTGTMAPELTAWCSDLLERGFAVCLVSNNWHDHVKGIADSLGFDMVAKALKPLPFGFRAAMKRHGATPASTAVIGDQMFTDILGGNLLGIMTVLVLPLSQSDLPHTLVLRRLEKVALGERRPLPQGAADRAN